MKQKFLLKTMLLLCALVAGGSSAWADTVDDVLNQAFTGITGTSYTDFSDKTGTSGAVYAGQCAGGNSSIQLRSKNSNSGIVTTTSGGKAKKITVVWNSNTSSGQTLNVYGKDAEYSDATDLYDNNKQGDLIGTIVYGTSTELTINDDYEYIGFRSKSGAMYLTSVTITWEAVASATPSISADNVNIAYDATSGSIAYTLANSTGNVEAEVISGLEWLDLGTVTSTEVPFTCSANPDGTERTAKVLLSFTGAEDKLITVTQAGNPTGPACTIDLTSYDFGTVAIGTPATKTFTVTTANLSGDVTLSMAGDDEFTVSPTTIAQDATSTEVTVTFTPTNADDFSAQLKVNNGIDFVNHDLADIRGKGAPSYTVTFDPGNGTCATATMDVFDGTEVDLPTATPNAVCTEAGWTFAGWATASVASGSTTATLLPSKYTVTENITLYAVYQLTNANGGSVTFDFGEIAETEGWTSGTAYTTVEISPITLTANGGGNNGKFYVSDETWRMYNGGSVSITSVAGAITSVTSDPSTTFTITNGSASQSFAATTMFKSITVNYATATFASSPVAAVATPEITGTTPFYGTNEVTITCGTDGATIQYSTDNGANWNTYTATFNINATTTVKAKATKTGWEDSEVAEKAFTAIAPLTVTEALTAIDALDNNGKITEQYVKGYVSTTGSVSSKTITYSISVDGNAANELKIYKGKGLNNADFTNASEIALGDEVVVYGTLQKYYNGTTVTPEFIEGNYLFHKNRHPAPEFTLDPTSKSLDAYSHETVDVTVNTNTDGAITCESSDEDVATVALKSAGVYTITAQTEGTATITIKSAVSENYAPASATVAITVTDDREDAEISFENATITKTWGQSFTGQNLTNTHSVDVVWSSTDETVATVDNTGAVTVLKAGETTIKATFAGNATYKAAVASYTLTVNKAAAGLSYATTSFDIMLNDASFVAPTLNNPNGLTVTYASNNETVAVVDENTGDLVYDETAAGTAMITASFVGNDWYKSGSASYTINIIDPTVKGCKYNPYTVAEVITMAPTSTSAVAEGQGDIYVTGYIVGEYRNPNNTTTTVSTNSFTTDANIALADDPTTTALASSIPVNLTKTADQKAFGNKTNNGKTIGYKVLVKGDALKYFGMPGLKNIDEISAISVPATFNASGYATFASTYALDFTDDSEFSAWQITGVSGTTITFEQISSSVKAGTGVLLMGTASTSINIPVAASGDDISSTNKLEGITTATDVTADEYFGLKGNKFVKVNAGTVPAGKALLPASVVAGARELTFDFGGETNGVAEVRSQMDEVRGSVYNLNGQKVEKPGKGMYIMNGRKVIFK